MKNVIVSMLIVIALAAGACVFSVCTVARACGALERLRVEAAELCEKGQAEAALDCVRRMQMQWMAYDDVLAAVLPHSAMEEITAALIEAEADLTAGEMDEFMGDMKMLARLLHRMEEDERLQLSNILSIC